MWRVERGGSEGRRAPELQMWDAGWESHAQMAPWSLPGSRSPSPSPASAPPTPHPPPVCLAHGRCSEVLALRLEHLNLSFLCCVEVRSCPIHLGSSELGSGPGTLSAPITWGGKECAACAKSESWVRDFRGPLSRAGEMS